MNKHLLVKRWLIITLIAVLCGSTGSSAADRDLDHPTLNVDEKEVASSNPSFNIEQKRQVTNENGKNVKDFVPSQSKLEEDPRRCKESNNTSILLILLIGSAPILLLTVSALLIHHFRDTLWARCVPSWQALNHRTVPDLSS
jgi:hypothetical protein